MLFLLNYSLFLRIEVNKQLDKRQFFRFSANGSFPLCFDQNRKCHFYNNRMIGDSQTTYMENETQIVCRYDQALNNVTQICHKDPDFSSDASRITLTVLGTFLACFLFAKVFWYVKSYGWACEENRKRVAARPPKIPFNVNIFTAKPVF